MESSPPLWLWDDGAAIIDSDYIGPRLSPPPTSPLPPTPTTSLQSLVSDTVFPLASPGTCSPQLGPRPRTVTSPYTYRRRADPDRTLSTRPVSTFTGVNPTRISTEIDPFVIHAPSERLGRSRTRDLRPHSTTVIHGSGVRVRQASWFPQHGLPVEEEEEEEDDSNHSPSSDRLPNDTRTRSKLPVRSVARSALFIPARFAEDNRDERVGSGAHPSSHADLVKSRSRDGITSLPSPSCVDSLKHAPEHGYGERLDRDERDGKCCMHSHAPHVNAPLHLPVRPRQENVGVGYPLKLVTHLEEQNLVGGVAPCAVRAKRRGKEATTSIEPCICFAQRRRCLWITATLTLVIVATGATVGGILWKLCKM